MQENEYFFPFTWSLVRDIANNDYTCGYCGKHVSSNVGMPLIDRTMGRQINNFGVYICTKCQRPTFLFEDKQIPGVKFGDNISHLPSLIYDVYNEARQSYSSGSFTGVVLLCRKLLMQIATELGAKEDLKFIEYVDYLEENNFITAKSKMWVDLIRKNGNKRTHEVEIASKEEAELMIKFSEMILKINFEYPNMLMDNEDTQDANQ